ncbi:MAG: tetratricopeptide repeat protein, partial [Desulfobacteraceae bacterium]|nr:tetratricopeptide repeat protein [Desulfobacteraceae bacterium]
MTGDFPDFPITPDLNDDAKTLNKLTRQFNDALEKQLPIGKDQYLESMGRLLWKASGLGVEKFLDAVEDAKDEEPPRPVRLIIKGREFQHLPWELIYNDHPEIGFAALHPWCTVSRRVKGSGKKTPATTQGPLRILLFISSPDDLDPEKSRLDYEKEVELLFAALDEPYFAGKIDIDVAVDGCLNTLVRQLESTRYHALIMSMHGTTVKDKNNDSQGCLLFEKDLTWKKDLVTASAFAEKMEYLPNPPGLILVSACQSAKADETSGTITDVTGRLHKAGIQRVIGMRLSVIDKAASLFSAELFRYLSKGGILGRAVSHARNEVAQGEYSGGFFKKTGGEKVLGDILAQWTLPVLLDRTTDGPLLHLNGEARLKERPPLPSVLIGDGTIHLPTLDSFIGRRSEIRRFLGPFLQKETRCLMFTGPGGVGKTTLAALFTRKLLEKEPDVRLMGFRAPFDFDTIYEPLRKEAFDGTQEEPLHAFIQNEDDIKERIRMLLVSLAKRERPFALVLDNLETLQDINTLEVQDSHSDSFWFIKTVCELPSPARVLMTGRYALPQSLTKDLPENTVSNSPIQEAPFGDILNRMRRLKWPQSMEAKEKREIYNILGGNHRAIEWTAQLLRDDADKAENLVEALKQVKAPPSTDKEKLDFVLETMRQDLLFSRICDQLTTSQKRLVQALSLYRVPVNEDGIVAAYTTATDLPNHEEDLARLLNYSLLEAVYNPVLELGYYSVPTIIMELSGEPEFSSKELRTIHKAMGIYHRAQGKYVTRKWSDDIEGIHHFRRACEHDYADELAEDVCGYYYRISNFADAKHLTKEIVKRESPPPPWWALNRYGQCQLTLGKLDDAKWALKKAESVAVNEEDRGTTLNNISGIFRARGDYETALKYLEDSLKIRQEIGDKAGEGTTLNNMATTAYARGDYETALKYLEDSLKIRQEIGDKAGEGTTLNNIS